MGRTEITVGLIGVFIAERCGYGLALVPRAQLTRLPAAHRFPIRGASGLLKPWKSGDTAIPLTPALSRGRGSRIVRPERSTGFPGLRVSVRRDQES